MKRKIVLFIAVFALFISFANVGEADNFAVGAKLEDFKLADTGGKENSFNSLKGKNGTVLVFLSAPCPVVKIYNERINQIAADYAAKGIAFIGINSNATESLEWVKSHAAENYKFPMLIDKGNVLADKLGATVTPEVYYFDEKNVLLYHGAIDNDRSGKNVSENILRTAFDSKLGGKAIAKTKSSAFGCSIKRVEK
ncbi:MAG: redoxin domain-containing protein [Acidobacteriota bacterium]|nr:redoxin domain-containing protein [Acidobacteriota bacterium]